MTLWWCEDCQKMLFKEDSMAPHLFHTMRVRVIEPQFIPEIIFKKDTPWSLVLVIPKSAKHWHLNDVSRIIDEGDGKLQVVIFAESYGSFVIHGRANYPDFHVCNLLKSNSERAPNWKLDFEKSPVPGKRSC